MSVFSSQSNVKSKYLIWSEKKCPLKTLFNIVEERFKKLLNFDVSAV